MTRYRQIHGERVPFTAEEETQRDAEEAQAVIDKQAFNEAEAVVAANKASAEQKLKDLGLTDAEISAFIR